MSQSPPSFNKPRMSISQTSERPTSQARQSKKITPYFPPPPTPGPIEKRKSGRRSYIPPALDTPAAIPMLQRPPKRSNLRHTIGRSSTSRKRRLKELHLPDIKLSPRHWILVGLLLTSFLTLILGFIFAECVALPHTANANINTNTTLDTDGTSLYVRQTGIANTHIPSAPAAAAASTTSEGGIDPASINTNTTTPAEAEASESKRLGFDSPRNLAILFFYTATLPLLTILLTIIELIMLCHTNTRSSTDSDNDSTMTLKPLALASKLKSPNLPTTKPKLRAFLPALSLTASTLLTCGWIATTTIQLHCEIAPLSPNQAICPVQIRGHFMRGVHELSVVKNVAAWGIVVVYVGYVAWCVRVNLFAWRAEKEGRLAMKVQRDLEGKRVEQLSRGVVRFVVDEDVDVKKMVGGEGERKKVGAWPVVNVKEVR